MGGLRDYVDPAILKRGRPAFVALGDNKLRVELLQKLAAAGYSTPVFISDRRVCQPQRRAGAWLHHPAAGVCRCGRPSGRGLHRQRGSIVDHNAHLGRGVHVAPGGIVKASAEVAEFGKVDSGEIVRSPWENQ